MRYTLNKANNDTTHKAKIKQKSKLQQEKDDGSPSTKSILEDQLKSYKEIIKMDTSFILNERDTVKVKLKHYCTYDNKINLPPRYLKIYHITKFKTHNFISSLNVKINSKLVFKGFIKKDDFINLLDKELKSYGVLSSPNVEFTDNSLLIQYSISVPLSDVGKGFTIKIDSAGKKQVIVD
jgi:hypothetical protein